MKVIKSLKPHGLTKQRNLKLLQEWLLVKYPSSSAGNGRRHAT